MPRNRNRISILRAAAMCALFATPLYREGEGDKGAGGADDKKEPPKKEEPKKIELTAEELDAKIQAAVADRDKAHEKKLADDKAKADEEAARKRGEFEGIAKTEQTKREAAEFELKKRDVKDAVAEYLRANHKEYAASGVEKYIMPQVEFDAKTPQDDIAKRVKSAADQYVKDNPRAVGKGPTPPPGRSGGAPGTSEKKQTPENLRGNGSADAIDSYLNRTYKGPVTRNN